MKVFDEAVGNGQTIPALESRTNLLQMPKADVIVTGWVHRLGHLIRGSPFVGSRDDELVWVNKRFGRSRKKPSLAWLPSHFLRIYCK